MTRVKHHLDGIAQVAGNRLPHSDDKKGTKRDRKESLVKSGDNREIARARGKCPGIVVRDCSAERGAAHSASLFFFIARKPRNCRANGYSPHFRDSQRMCFNASLIY